MADTIAYYTGDGVTNSWSVPFNYLSKTHIELYVNDVEDTTFTWITDSTIAASSTPANAADVIVKRVTPRDALVTSIASSGTLRGNDVNRIGLQALYVAQEGYDALTSVLAEDPDDGIFDAENKRIKNLDTPTEATDAVTKEYVDDVVELYVEASESADEAAASAAAALASQVAAASSASSASTSASTATTQASAASSSASAASSSASAASTSATTATTQASAAASSASAASSSASSASTSASTATTQASNASASATAADASADAAALSETAAAASALAADASADIAVAAEASIAGYAADKLLSNLIGSFTFDEDDGGGYPVFNLTGKPSGFGNYFYFNPAAGNGAVDDFLGGCYADGRSSVGGNEQAGGFGWYTDDATAATFGSRLELFWYASGNPKFVHGTGATFVPSISDSIALGSSTKMWSDLFLASGAVIDFNSDVSLTHSANLLTLAGGGLTISGSLTATGGTNELSATNIAGYLTVSGDIYGRSNTARVLWGTADDIILTRDAAGTLAQRNGTNAQTFNLYGTYTDASNYERASATWVSSEFQITTSGAGTGANNRSLRLKPGGAVSFETGSGWGINFIENSQGRWKVEGGQGHFYPWTTNTYDLGGSSNKVRDLYIGNDILLSSGSIINFDNSNMTITHSAGNLAFSGAVTLGTDLALTEGGTGASTAEAAARNLNSGRVKLASNTFTGAGFLDLVFSSFTANVYSAYEVVFHFLPSTDATDLWLRYSTDGGSTFDTSGYNHARWAFRDDGASGLGNSASDAKIVLDTSIGNASTEGISGTVKLLNPGNTSLWNRSTWQTYGVSSDATPTGKGSVGGGSRETAQDIDAIRFMFSSGNINGSYTLYGVY